MKTKLITIFILLFGLASNYCKAQIYSGREMALISFNYNVHQNIKSQIDGFSHLFPDVDHRRADKVIASMKERTWYLIKDRLESEIGMYILPLNAYGKRFRYDHYGFPNVSINRALRQGASRYYLRIDLSISEISSRKEGGYSASLDTISADGAEISGGILPQVSITATIYSDKGILPHKRVSTSTTASSPWIITEYTLTGIINHEGYNENETDTVLGLINVATTSLISNF